MIIGITGERQTGKNTLANYIQYSNNLISTRRHIIEIKSFAAKLKSLCQEMFPLIKNMDYYEYNPIDKEIEIPKYKMSPRDIWIKVGQELRTINPDVFVEYLINNITNFDRHYIISDVRFQNEIDHLKKANAVIIKLNRNNGLKKIKSEKQIKNFKVDIEFDNNGSVNELLILADAIVKNYLN
jgi:hypothetical protein